MVKLNFLVGVNFVAHGCMKITHAEAIDFWVLLRTYSWQHDDCMMARSNPDNLP